MSPAPPPPDNSSSSRASRASQPEPGTPTPPLRPHLGAAPGGGPLLPGRPSFAPPPSRRRRPPAAAARTLHVRPWIDPLLEQRGHEARSPYVERYWLPVMGPSATVLLRHLAAGFDERPDGYETSLVAVAQALGMVGRGGPTAAFRRTVDRVMSFGFAQFIDNDTMIARVHLPLLTRRQLNRLTPGLQTDHRHHEVSRREPSAGRPESDEPRVRALALSLFDVGEEPAAIEGHLLQLHFDGDVVAESVRWAVSHRCVVPGPNAPRAPAPALEPRWGDDAA